MLPVDSVAPSDGDLRRRWRARCGSWSPRRACGRSDRPGPARSGGLAAPPVLIIRLKSTSGRSWNSTSNTSRPFFSLKRFGCGRLERRLGPGGGRELAERGVRRLRGRLPRGAAAWAPRRGAPLGAGGRRGAGGGRRGGGRGWRGRAGEGQHEAAAPTREQCGCAPRHFFTRPMIGASGLGSIGDHHAPVLSQVLLRGALDGGGVDRAVAAQVLGEEAGVADHVVV